MVTMLVGVDSDPYTSGKHSQAWEKPQGTQQDRKSYVFKEQGRYLSSTLARNQDTGWNMTATVEKLKRDKEKNI